MKPFKPPTLVKQSSHPTQQAATSLEPPAKKRRISSKAHDDDEAEVISATANILKQPKPAPKFQTPARKPLGDVKNPSSLPSSSQNEDASQGYYAVLW